MLLYYNIKTIWEKTTSNKKIRPLLMGERSGKLIVRKEFLTINMFLKGLKAEYKAPFFKG